MKSVKTTALLIALGAAVLSLANCTPDTALSRVERNYGLYQTLSPKHQELVHQGRIVKGMSKSAVYLAYGDPARKSQGYRDGANFERWDYTRIRPVYHNSAYMTFGSGFGHHRRGYSSFGFSPSVHYVPTRSASVWFRGGVVDSWDRIDQ